MPASQSGGTEEIELGRLVEYLTYYPLVSLQTGKKRTCNGAPSYRLQVGKFGGERAGTLQVALLLAGESKILWSKTYPAPSKPTAQAEAIQFAQIAYDVGYSGGVIANIAQQRQWSSSGAEKEFGCLMSGHRYFQVDGTPGFETARQCLQKIVEKGTKAPDIIGLYAALEAELALGIQPGDSNPARTRMLSAIEMGEKLNPLDKEILMVKLRNSRNGRGRNLVEASRVMSIMEKNYPMEPHVLNQLGIAYSTAFGDFENSIAIAQRGRDIAGPNPGIFWGELWGLVYRGEWTKANEFVRQLKPTSYYLDDLLILEISSHLGNKDDYQWAINDLENQGINSRSTLESRLDTLNYHPKLMDMLHGFAKNHFD